MTKLKKFLNIFVVMLLVVACLGAFVACGNDGGSGTTGGNGDNSGISTPDDKDNKPSDNDNKPNDNDNKPSDNDNKPSDNDNKPDDNDNKPAVAKAYIMEAEDTDLSFVAGGDTSASPQGASLIAEAQSAHGGKYIRALYVDQLFIEFEFEASAADDNATLVFNFGGESFGAYDSISFTNDEFEIFVNPTLDDEYYPADHDERIKYDEFSVGVVMGEFKKVTIATNVKIKEGTNYVYLLVNNTDSLLPTAATMNAKAPVIDYMEITSTATLTHTTYENV